MTPAANRSRLILIRAEEGDPVFHDFHGRGRWLGTCPALQSTTEHRPYDTQARRAAQKAKVR